MIPSAAPINYGTIVSGSNDLPAAVSPVYFYYRGTGFLVPSATGLHTLGVNCQDGCSLYIGNRALFDTIDKTDAANSTLGYTRSATIMLTKGVYYPITVEWQHGAGADCELQLIWTPPLGSAALIPNTNLTNAKGSVNGFLSGNWWNGTPGLWYPSGNGSIDFSNPSLPNKTIDHVGDGTTYARVLASTIQDGVVTGIAGMGASVLPAGAGPGLVTAPRGNVLMSDGNGDVDDAGIAVGDLVLTSGGSLIEGDLTFVPGVGITWNGDTGISRIGAGHIGIGDGTDGDITGYLELAQLGLHADLFDSTGDPGTAGFVLSSLGPGAGTRWVTSGGGGGGGGFSIYPTMTPPRNANFTFSNPNSYAVTNADKTGRELINVPTSSLGLAWMQNTALPSTPYTIDLGVMVVCAENIHVASICLMDGSGAIRAYGLRIDSAGAWSVVDQTWASATSPGTVNATYTPPASDGMKASEHIVFVRVTDDGTHRTIYWSPNGTDYFLLVQQATGTGITPTAAGIILYASASGPLTALVYHWLVSTSVLPQNA